jgi:hypothetical protein
MLRIWIIDGNVVYTDISIMRSFTAREVVFEKQ